MITIKRGDITLAIWDRKFVHMYIGWGDLIYLEKQLFRVIDGRGTKDNFIITVIPYSQ